MCNNKGSNFFFFLCGYRGRVQTSGVPARPSVGKSWQRGVLPDPSLGGGSDGNGPAEDNARGSLCPGQGTIWHCHLVFFTGSLSSPTWNKAVSMFSVQFCEMCNYFSHQHKILKKRSELLHGLCLKSVWCVCVAGVSQRGADSCQTPGAGTGRPPCSYS